MEAISLSKDEKRLVRKLKSYKKGKSFWVYISPGKQLSKKEANKFFLCCILDYQMQASFVWDNTRAFVDNVMLDPEDLWGVISNYSLEDWMQLADKHGLHRFPMAKQRVHRIACQLIDEYGGDVRNIWQDATAKEVSERLKILQAGEQISRMILGALYDCKLITGALDVKADVHVCRVLGRLLTGKPFTPAEAVKQTRRLYSKNPWMLDGKLFDCGRDYCFKENPDCSYRNLRKYCVYNNAPSK